VLINAQVATSFTKHSCCHSMWADRKHVKQFVYSLREVEMWDGTKGACRTATRVQA